MQRFAHTALVMLLTAVFAVASVPEVNNSVINYAVNPIQININGSGFSPQGKVPRDD